MLHWAQADDRMPNATGRSNTRLIDSLTLWDALGGSGGFPASNALVPPASADIFVAPKCRLIWECARTFEKLELSSDAFELAATVPATLKLDGTVLTITLSPRPTYQGA